MLQKGAGFWRFKAYIGLSEKYSFFWHFKMLIMCRKSDGFSAARQLESGAKAWHFDGFKV